MGVLLAQWDTAGPLASAAFSCLLALAEVATGPLLTLASKEPGPLSLPDRALPDVAGDVVARRMRFGQDPS